jgi:hypothetical protein
MRYREDGYSNHATRKHAGHSTLWLFDYDRPIEFFVFISTHSDSSALPAELNGLVLPI